ncbi:unnamed protein product [Gongylonema pulchrum]|uniref:Alkylglycerone-phosphate synthase n=1 Tax=Gongylonema pulchrum TaxID=637853 RepID=A0A3P7NQG6_9BILA|nr:unnamed protein product [Gongylonema pulchrum]
MKWNGWGYADSYFEAINPQELAFTGDRDHILKWNGWGYADSYFEAINPQELAFTGDRYEISGRRLPFLKQYMCETLGIDVDYRTPSVLYEEVSVPTSVDNQQFIDFLLEKGISFSNKSKYRLARSHGHTGREFQQEKIRQKTSDHIFALISSHVSSNFYAFFAAMQCEKRILTRGCLCVRVSVCLCVRLSRTFISGPIKAAMCLCVRWASVSVFHLETGKSYGAETLGTCACVCALRVCTDFYAFCAV